MQPVDPTTPVAPDAAELKMRRKLGMHNVQYLHPHQMPAYDAERVVRHRKCPYCLFHNGHLISVCIRCHNCMACGLYNPTAQQGVCIYCGNHNPTPVPARYITANRS